MKRTFRIGRASTLAIACLLAGASLAYADTVPADGDLVAPGQQMTVDLGEHAVGEVVQAPVEFSLTCAGLAHADEGTTIGLQLTTVSVPLDGTVSATATRIGPVPASWTDDSQGCASPAPQLPSNGPSIATLKMPTTPGNDFAYTLLYAKSGADGLTGFTLVTFQVDVVVNTPPTLVLPGPTTAEATSPDGATVAFVTGATDSEDAPDPTPVCTPASGTVFPLGTTTVACSVTDSGGLSASGSFDVTVGDSTAPTLGGVPATFSVTTSDPTGSVVSYSLPTAADAADPNPSVVCAPASGSAFTVGSTTVTCTATDATGNDASAAFAVTVRYVPDVDWSVLWGEPIGGLPAALETNTNRTVPIKVRIFADGVEQTDGSAAIHVVACGGDTAVVVPLTWSSGRWAGHLDVSGLRPGCYVAVAVFNGNDAGSFALDVGGAEAAKSSATEGTTTATPTGSAQPPSKDPMPDKAKGPKK
jgi:hypothetical protein